ncbi:hypothetical protein D3C72_2148580 [compost metagenome]
MCQLARIAGPVFQYIGHLLGTRPSKEQLFCCQHYIDGPFTDQPALIGLGLLIAKEDCPIVTHLRIKVVWNLQH